MSNIFVQGMCILAYALFICVMIAGYIVMESWPYLPVALNYLHNPISVHDLWFYCVHVSLL